MKKLVLILLMIISVSAAGIYLNKYFKTPVLNKKDPAAKVSEKDKDNEIKKNMKVTKLLVLKSKRKLMLFSGDKIAMEYNISLGEEPVGHKHFEGDNKTPEGNYIINDKNPNSDYYKNIGISYPNEEDKAYAARHGKSPGGQIKIHGLKNGSEWVARFHLQKDWTAGCIAVTNEEMEEIYQIVDIGTPIEIRP